MPSFKESSLTEPFFCRRDGLLLEAALSAPVAAGSCHHLKLDNPAADAAGPQFKRVALPLSLPAHRTRNTASNSSSPPLLQHNRSANNQHGCEVQQLPCSSAPPGCSCR